MTYCSPGTADRRKPFWTTQPAACGRSNNDCDSGECGHAGLAFDAEACFSSCECCPPAVLDTTCVPPQPPRTLRTDNWMRSLVINILSTRGRLPNTDCGYSPGVQGGHWSDTFRTDGQQAGNLIYSVPAARSINESIAQITARAQADLNKLVVMKVASAVSVAVTYKGGMQIALDIGVISAIGATTNVGLIGARSNNSWIWK